MKYLKLGPKANSFSDPLSQVSLSGKMVVEVTQAQANSQKIKTALRGGHLENATEKEYVAWVELEKKGRPKFTGELSNAELLQKVQALQKEVALLTKEKSDLSAKLSELESGGNSFNDMTKSDLSDYYTENWEVSEEELAEFEKLKKDEMIAFIQGLEKLDE